MLKIYYAYILSRQLLSKKVKYLSINQLLKNIFDNLTVFEWHGSIISHQILIVQCAVIQRAFMKLINKL